MPAFIKTEADEVRWEEAKKAAHKSGGAKDKWALVNHIYQNMKENTYQDLINDLVEEILETTGTGGVAIGPGSSLGTMRHQEKSPDPIDLKLDPANIKLVPSIYPDLVPKKQVVSKENFNYDEKRGNHIVKGQYDKTAKWLRAIMDGQAEAEQRQMEIQQQEFGLQKQALGLTKAEHAHELDFQQQKLDLDAKRMALKAKFASKTPKSSPKKK